MFIHADYITDIEERNNVDNWFVVLIMLVSIILHIIGECKFNCGLNTFTNCNSIHFRTFLCFSVIDLVYLSMLFTSFKSVSQHSSAQSSSRHPPGHHGCDRETGLRRGAAHTDKRERDAGTEEPDQPDIETRRELPRGARAVGSITGAACLAPATAERA